LELTCEDDLMPTHLLTGVATGSTRIDGHFCGIAQIRFAWRQVIWPATDVKQRPGFPLAIGIWQFILTPSGESSPALSSSCGRRLAFGRRTHADVKVRGQCIASARA